MTVSDIKIDTCLKKKKTFPVPQSVYSTVATQITSVRAMIPQYQHKYPQGTSPARGVRERSAIT